jgi:F-type H+-transporting ATPase subunit epsilon
MTAKHMQLKILLPFGVYEQRSDVKRIVAETTQGSFGFLPNRLDCVTALVPGIFTYEVESEGVVYVAIDKGIMVKANEEVLVSVRNAIGGRDLGELHKAVRQEFLHLNEQEQEARLVLKKLETGFIRRFQQLQQE